MVMGTWGKAESGLVGKRSKHYCMQVTMQRSHVWTIGQRHVSGLELVVKSLCLQTSKHMASSGDSLSTRSPGEG
jgi:hypothetical protein